MTGVKWLQVQYEEAGAPEDWRDDVTLYFGCGEADAAEAKRDELRHQGYRTRLVALEVVGEDAARPA